MRIVTIDEMKEIESLAESEYGFNSSLIIENVGLRGATFIQEKIFQNQSHQVGEVLLLVGKGNNGADGLAIGRHLREYGHKVRAFMLFSYDESSSEVQKQAKLAKAFGVKILEVSTAEEINSYLDQYDDEHLIIDAIFGTGVRLPLSNMMRDVIEIINKADATTVSIDIPTGIMGDTGEVQGTVVDADFTLAVGLPKIGYYAPGGSQHMGKVYVVACGLPKDLLSGGDKNLLSPKLVSKILDRRNKFHHKNKFGHTLVVGGSRGLNGALVLSASATLKVGTGLVTAVTWENNYSSLVAQIRPEVMTGQIPVNIEEGLGALERYDSVVIGPGLGKSPQSAKIVVEVLKNFSGPVILDADAINTMKLKEHGEILRTRRSPLIITPHMGEFSRFCDIPKSEVMANPMKYLKELVDQINCYVILKGPSTFVGFPTGEIFINYGPNDGMAKGGSGDVLAGILGGLLAQAQAGSQSYIPELMNNKFDASVCLSLVVHTLSGKYAADKWGVRGMTAGSINDHIHEAFTEINRYNKSAPE